MTKEERVKELASQYRLCANDNRFINSFPNTKEDIECIAEALEKQIPKKPIIEESRKAWSSNNPFETVTVNVFTCPCCAAKIMYRAHVKRCLECGQAIDWSDE